MGGRDCIIIQNFKATERVLRGKLASVSRLLFLLCQDVERTPQSSILRNIESGKLQKWLVAYKKEIADRKARQIAREERMIALEKEKEKKKAAREKVLSKLTPEEKKILRIR